MAQATTLNTTSNKGKRCWELRMEVVNGSYQKNTINNGKFIFQMQVPAFSIDNSFL